jgi:hypothetical protein
MAGVGEGGNAGQRDAIADATSSPTPSPKRAEAVPGKETQIGRLLASDRGGPTKVGHQSLIQKEYGAGGASKRAPGTYEEAAALLGVTPAAPTSAAPHHAKHGHAAHAHAAHAHAGKPATDTINTDGQNATRADLLTVEPPAIHFGKVPLRAKEQTEAATYEITATNPTADAITLDDLRADAAADFPIFSADTTDTTIPPGGTFRFRVGFRPHRVGPHSSTVHLIQRGVSVGRVQVEATALDESDHWEALGVSPTTLKFPGTAIGEASAPEKVTVRNRSGVPVRVEDLAPIDGAGDQFNVYEMSADEIPAGATGELAVAFRPTRRGVQHATFQLRTAGSDQAKDLAHGKITARGDGLYAADARHDDALAGRPIGPVTTYAEMLATLQAAQQFTEAGAGQDAEHGRDDYAHARQLVEPVKLRMDVLAEHLHDVAGDLGLASTTTILTYGAAHTAVTDWYRQLALGATIEPRHLVTSFEVAEEIIKVLTGEQKDAPTLRTLGRAAKWTPLEIAGGAFGGALLGAGGGYGAALAAEAWPAITSTLSVDWYAARQGASIVATWALSHPEATYELSIFLGSIGFSIADAGGLSNWLHQIDSFESFVNVLGQMMDPVVQHEQSTGGRRNAPTATGMDLEPGAEPLPTARARGSATPEPEPEPAAGGSYRTRTPTPQEPDESGGAPGSGGKLSPAAERIKSAVVARARGAFDRIQALADRARAEAPLVAEGAPLPSLRTPRALRDRVVEVRAQVDGALAEAGASRGSYRVEVLDDRAYAKKFGADRGPAAMVIEHDQPTVYASTNATETDLAHEATHIAQLRDTSKPQVQESIRILSDETLNPSKWKQADPGLRKELYERKLDVEIDAATRELNTAEGDARAQLEHDLAELRQRQADVGAITEEQLLKMKAGAAPLPDFLEDPSFLFARGRAVVEGQKMPSPYHYQEKGDYKRTPVTDSPAAKAGAKVEQIGETWTEAIVVTSTYKGRATVERQAGATIVYVDEASGTRRRYVAEADAKLSVSTGDDVEPGTPLMHERSKKYRLVDVNGELRVEELIKRGRWQLAGEHARNRGLVTEDAARAQVDAELASEMQKPPDQRRDQLAGFARLDNQTGSGAGFDDVVVEFHGDPPTATIRIIETKDYPNRSVPLADMTAIRDNLVTNRNRLRAQVATALDAATPEGRAPAFREMNDTQVQATFDALNDNNVQVELRLGPTTRVSPQTLDKLRIELAASFGGRDVLAPTPIAVGQDFIDEAAAKRFPSPTEGKKQ